MTGLVAHTATAPLGSGCIYSAPSYKMGESSADPGLADALSIASAASEQQPESDLEKGIRWAGQYGLYQHLLAEEELRYSDNVLSTFFTEQDNGIMGRLHRAIKGFNAARTGQASLTDHAGAISAAGQSALLPEQRLAEVLDILYANAADLPAMGSNEEARLREIAILCPLEEGFGVYMARSALLKVDTLPRHYVSDCERIRENDSEQWKTEEDGKPHGGEFAVYPNPNNGEMTLRYLMPESGEVRLEMFDMVGRRVMARTLPDGQGTVGLSVGDASSGLYTIVIRLQGRPVFTERVSVMKQ